MSEPEPLPLEDAPPRVVQDRSRMLPRVLLVLLCVVLAVGTFAILQLRHLGDLREFRSEDGSCRVLLPGAWKEKPVSPPEGFSILGGKHFYSSPWTTRLEGSVRWYNLNPSTAIQLRGEDLFAAEIARRTKELDAKVAGEAVLKYGDLLGRDVDYSVGKSHYVERMIFVPTGPRPRLYILFIGGRGFQADSPVAQQILDSFRVS